MSKPRIRLMSHLIAGFPDLGESARVAQGLVDGGSESREVQFPYSDPTADGAAIQAACESALQNGFRVDDGFRLVAELGKTIDRPIFIMSYAGLVIARGIERFLSEAKKSGAAGVIIPDLMPGYDEGLFVTGARYGLAVVPVIAPSVTDVRLAEILAMESPFLYAAIRTGITGKRSAIDSSVVDFLSRVKRPGTTLIAGFGISDADQAQNLQAYADVLVVGSAFVRAVIDGIESNSDIRKVIARKASDLSGGALNVEKKKRLTDAEIRKAVDKIRKRYEDYMVTYEKDREALDFFEDRYISAMRARMGLETFLHAEVAAVEALVRKEQGKIDSETDREKTAIQEQVKRESIAERVLAENLERIAKYPRVTIHEEASEDVERLFGALGTIEREFWTDLERLFRKAYTSMMMSPRGRLEEQLRKLCEVGPDGIPPRLSRYQSLLGWFPRNYGDIDKESKKCLVDAAFFLHDLYETLKEVEASEELSIPERQKVEGMKQYVHNVLDDFRLREFKNLRRP